MNPNNTNFLPPHPLRAKEAQDSEDIRQMFRDAGIEVPASGFGIGHDLGDTGAILTLGIEAGKERQSHPTPRW
jgi:hypothetical protein